MKQSSASRRLEELIILEAPFNFPEAGVKPRLVPQDTQDHNFDRRKRRKKKKKDKKCKGDDHDPGFNHAPGFNGGKPYRYVDCVPTADANYATKFPTWSPTMTPVPTISAFPTKAPAPAPVTIAPVNPNNDISAACEALSNGQVYETDRSLDISYVYELATDLSRNFDSVVDSLDAKVGAFLASKLVPCQQTTRRRRHLAMLGVGPGARDKLLDPECTALTVAAAEKCYYMWGSIVLYISDSSKITKEEASDGIYKVLQTAFNNGADQPEERRQLEENSPFLDVDQGILGLYFHGAALDSDGQESGEVPANSERAPLPAHDSNFLGGLGIGVIVAACVGVLLVGLFAVKKRPNNRVDKDQRGVYLADSDTIDDSNAKGLSSESPTDWLEKSTDWGDSNDDDESFILGTKVLSDDASSIFSGLDAHGGYECTNDLYYEDLELTPTFVSARGDIIPMPSVYTARDYVITDTVDF